MFSRLDPLFKTQMRHTETLDTRQAIRRHEPDAERRHHGDKNHKKNDDDLWEDHTTVSVSALRAFLQQLLSETATTRIQAEQQSTENTVSSSKDNQELSDSTGHQGDEQSLRAAQAYERTYRATHHEEQEITNNSAIPAIVLRPEEVRTIHQLTKDLDYLWEKQTTHLELQKSTSFLQSLVDAVARVKNL